MAYTDTGSKKKGGPVPKRSNEFQSLVRVVQKHVAAVGATVHESAMLPDAHTQQKREVDIVIVRVVDGVQLLTGIECMDHQRRASTPWVEGMWAKHQALPTARLILASRGGFYDSARAKAAALGLAVIGYEDGVADGVGRLIIGRGGEVWVKNPTAYTIVGFRLKTELKGHWVPAPDIWAFPDIPESEQPIYRLINARVHEELDSIKGEGPFSELAVVTQHTVGGDIPDEARPVWIKRGGQFIEAVAFEADFELTMVSHRLRLSEANIGGVPTAWGKFEYDGNCQLMVINEGVGPHPKISIVDDPD